MNKIMRWPLAPLAEQSSKQNLRTRHRARPRRATLIAGTLMVCVAPHALAAERLAQRLEPRITVAPSIVAVAASQVPIPIDVGPAQALPRLSFVRLRGLPPFVALTEGHSVGPGSWAIPLNALSKLRANVPAGVAARAELAVALVNIDGTPLAETKTLLIVRSAVPAATADLALGAQANEVAELAPPPAPAPAPKSVSPSRAPRAAGQNAPAERLLAQGERYLAQGTVAGARLFFRQAADQGLAAGAVRLGATYDPNELAKLKVQGIVADVAEARRWYERARELGAADAEQRLARLGGR